MVYKTVIISANVKKPKVGDQYCDWGIAGRSGYFYSYIKKITKNHIELESGEKISLKKYYCKEVLNSL